MVLGRIEGSRGWVGLEGIWGVRWGGRERGMGVDRGGGIGACVGDNVERE